ncbi:hypothetical protein [Anatilimnocola floriformis]|uniref:hypothetical protein n=1 Tax=Anatilimnocola floriformis TaxID=2948575 RepID=UPI0020C38FCD|nr:hypothetical protein [Anatilimnocola floriformis]
MLERLAEVDWQSLSHAYGDASDVPDMIRALASPQATIRNQAWENLFNSVRHQGTIYDATPEVVPFLIELLKCDSLPDKAEFLKQLFRYSPDFENWMPYYSSHPKRAPPFEIPTRQSMDDGFDVYLPLLNDPDSVVRRRAARLLTLCFSRRDQVASVLRNQIAAEPVAHDRAAMALLLAVLNRIEDKAFFAELSVHEPTALVRLTAAMACVHLEQSAVPEHVLLIIEQLAANDSQLFAQLPQEEGNFATQEFVIDSALDKLLENGTAGAGLLKLLLESTSTEVRKLALKRGLTIARQIPAAMEAVSRLLDESDANFRGNVAFHLGDLAIVAIFKAKIRKDREAYAILERELNNTAPIAVDALASRLTIEEDVHVRGKICRALKYLALWALGSTTALGAVASRESDARAAIEFIEGLNSSNAVTVYRIAMHSEDKLAWMGERKLITLGISNATSVVSLLIGGLTETPSIAESCANILGALGQNSRSAKTALEGMLNHSSEGVRTAARDAIKAIE